MNLNLGYVPQEITTIKGEIQILFKHQSKLLISNGKYLQEVNNTNTLNCSILCTTFASNKPVKVAYSKRHDIYFILFDDWQVYVLSSSLVYFTKISVITSYPIEIQFNDDSQSLYIIQSNKIEQVFMDIKRTSLQIKVTLLNKLSFGSATTYFIGFSMQNSLLFLWEPTSLKVYSNYELISDKIGITKHSITCLLYFQSYNYSICGTQDGKIYTWTLHNQNQPINVFETDHGQPIEQLTHDKGTEFWSCANNEISLYSIATWQCLQVYKMNIQYKQLFIVNPHKLFTRINDQIYFLSRSLEQRNLYNHKSDLRCQISDTQFLFENNSLVSIEETSKFQINYIKTKSTIIEVSKFQSTYYFLTDSSDILQFQNDNLSLVLKNDHIHNQEGALVRNKINNIKVFNNQCLFLYMQQGQILIFKIPNFQRSITELNYNRCSIKLSTIHGNLLLTLDEHNNFKLLQIKDNVVTLLQSLQFQVNLSKMLSKENKLFMLTCKGELGIFKYQNNEFKMKQYEEEKEEYFLNDFQVNFSPNLIFGMQTQCIVIMTFKKVILRILNFDAHLLCFGFFNGALILCLQNEISVVEDQRFSFTSEQIKEYNSDVRYKGTNGFEIYQQQTITVKPPIRQLSQSKQKSSHQIVKQQSSHQQDILIMSSTQIMNQSSRGRKKDQPEIVKVSRPSTQYSQPFRPQQWSYEQEIDTCQLLYQPAIPQLKPKKNSLTSQFLESRQKKQKFKTRRDLTMNKIVQRNIRLLQLSKV